jgi:hypothetical protein
VNLIQLPDDKGLLAGFFEYGNESDNFLNIWTAIILLWSKL